MNKYKANLLVLLITLGWGSSYLFMKMGLDSMEEFNLLALRFGIAFLVTGLVFWRRLRKIDKTTIGYGAVLGAILLWVCVSILFGLKTTSTSNAGFLVGLTVVFVPILSVFLFRKKLELSHIVGALIAMTGIGMLTLNSKLQMHPGDILCISSGISNALFILISGAAVKKTDSINVGIVSLGFTALFALILSFIFESPVLPGTFSGWTSILALSLVCSAFCFIAQSVSLKYIPPVQLGLMYALEPIFAAVIAFMFAGERLTLQGYIGAMLVVGGILVSQWLEQRKKLLTGAAQPVSH
ncbi:multidrug transporter [Paenibacillus sp. FSL R7-0273]|uniref:DMT family transporter n=1 Tax=Paenibacillus sp. FSL R7-0273 TaxID=1536772 RepID=UPI0004F63F65|nr:DMT family transporter [Paenibacillus sp. FSL R7-0273]AIQ48633.1 multidrug transporter [Paenibacillus sp. FSL R7-0273]OMF94023.1 EamA family transporter [Paenibacillus sp. FSL R7-0273]